MAAFHSKRNSVRFTRSPPGIASANPQKGHSNDHIREISPSYCPIRAISPFPSRNARAPVALPQLRHCTLGYLHPYVERDRAYPEKPEPPCVPFLRLRGRWLHKAGFAIGTPVRILVTPGRLVLEVDDIRKDQT